VSEKFYGIIGDCNPIEHGGGVVYENEHGIEVVYFRGWSDDYGPRVSIARFTVEKSVIEDLPWVDWKGVASFIGVNEEALLEYAVANNVLARAQVYESIGSYHGFQNLDHEQRELTLEEAENEYGELVDRAHRESQR